MQTQKGNRAPVDPHQERVLSLAKTAAIMPIQAGDGVAELWNQGLLEWDSGLPRVGFTCQRYPGLIVFVTPVRGAERVRIAVYVDGDAVADPYEAPFGDGQNGYAEAAANALWIEGQAHRMVLPERVRS